MNRADQIYAKVIDAMQEAEEIGGVHTPKQYQDLMQRIENTARIRFYNSVDLERDELEDTIRNVEKHRDVMARIAGVKL